jgi:hypothetical protein
MVRALAACLLRQRYHIQLCAPSRQLHSSITKVFLCARGLSIFVYHYVTLAFTNIVRERERETHVKWRGEGTAYWRPVNAYVPIYALKMNKKIKLSPYAMQAPRGKGGIAPTYS